ncbi:MAG: 30S ribosomal protein S15 [Methanomassiliicoccales archaeon]
MSRMHSSKKGRAGSKRPPVTESPAWVPMKPNEVIEVITQLGKSGKTSAQIGLTMRDQYGVPDVTLLTGKSITQIMAENGAVPAIPEDLASLVERARSLSLHLRDHKKDYSNKRGLQLIESKIRRLAKYYMREGKLPSTWSYTYEGTKQ